MPLDQHQEKQYSLPPGTVFDAALKANPNLLALSLEQAVSLAQNLPPKLPAARVRVKGPADLTARECEIAGLIASGKTNGEIADELVLSKRTIEKHIAHILVKLGAGNRAQVVRWALDAGLVKPSN